jgi:hypothetical protein
MNGGRALATPDPPLPVPLAAAALSQQRAGLISCPIFRRRKVCGKADAAWELWQTECSYGMIFALVYCIGFTRHHEDVNRMFGCEAIGACKPAENNPAGESSSCR